MVFGNTVGINTKYVTLHDLARELNKPERQIRYRFHSLRKAGKLTQDIDFIRDDFTDPLHFAYKINPVRFMEEAHLYLDPPSSDHVGTKDENIDSSLPTSPSELDTNDQAQDESFGNKGLYIGSSSDNKIEESGTNSANTPEHFGGKEKGIGNQGEDKDMSLDYIETLKGQLKVKDGQIDAYKTQLADQSDLNKGIIGELLKAEQQIRQLASGRVEEPEIMKAEEHDRSRPDNLSEERDGEASFQL